MSFIIGSNTFSTYLPDDYIVIDLEATGNSKFNYIIELSALKVKNNEIIDEFNYLVKPPKYRICNTDSNKINSSIKINNECIYYIDSFIETLTGINNEMIYNAKDEKIVIKEFYDFVGESIIIGHGMQNDLMMLNEACIRVLGKKYKCEFIDTYELGFLIDQVEYSLVNLCNKFNIENSEVHRARSDAFRTYLCYKKLKSIILNDDEVFKNGFDKKIKSMINSQKNNLNKKRINKFNKMNWSKIKNFLMEVGNIEDFLYERNIFISPYIDEMSKNNIEKIILSCNAKIVKKMDDETDFLISNILINSNLIDKFIKISNSNTKQIEEKDNIYYDEIAYIKKSILNHKYIKVLNKNELYNAYNLGYDTDIIFEESDKSFLDFKNKYFYLYDRNITFENIKRIKEYIYSIGGKVSNEFNHNVKYIVIGKKDDTFINSKEFIKFILLISSGASIFLINESRFIKK